VDAKELGVVEAFVSAINRHHISDLAQLMALDHIFVDSTGRIQSGRENMSAGWTAYFSMFPDYQIHVERMLADKAVVAVFGTASGTYKGKRGVIEENRIVMPAAWKALVEHGQIKLWQVYADWTEGWKTIERDNESG
jgi:predicted ester cyclase